MIPREGKRTRAIDGARVLFVFAALLTLFASGCANVGEETGQVTQRATVRPRA